MIARSQPRLPAVRHVSVLVAALALSFGAAGPAFAQTTTGDDPTLSPYETTSTATSPTPPPAPPKTTPKPAPKPPVKDNAPDNSGTKADQATNTSPQPAAQQPVATTGSTGSPARLAYTGGEPMLIAAVGAVLLLAAGVLQRRRRFAHDRR